MTIDVDMYNGLMANDLEYTPVCSIGGKFNNSEGCQIKHVPTGKVAVSVSEKTYRENRNKALEELDKMVKAAKAKPLTVNITPTWQGVLPLLLAAIENGTAEGKSIAKAELAKMAKAADLYNEAMKAKE